MCSPINRQHIEDRHCNRQMGAKLKGDYAPVATATRITLRDWWS